MCLAVATSSEENNKLFFQNSAEIMMKIGRHAHFAYIINTLK